MAQKEKAYSPCTQGVWVSIGIWTNKLTIIIQYHLGYDKKRYSLLWEHLRERTLVLRLGHGKSRNLQVKLRDGTSREETACTKSYSQERV